MEPTRIATQIPENIMQNWQDIVDIMAQIIGIPAGLIMRLRDPEIEVLVSSRSAGNPYRPGDSEPVWGSGLYCETVIKSGRGLLVPNALADEYWNANPDIKLNMISYFGFPIHLPDGKPFGTICVLDQKHNDFSEKFEKLILKFRDVVQSDLEVIHMNQVLGDENRRLLDYLTEIKTLRGIIPICSHCKAVRDHQGAWHSIEQYLERRGEADVSHSICPACAKKLYPDYDIYDD